MNEPSRKLAATALGVPIDTDADGVRAAFLKKLAGAQFVPPDEWLAAMNLLNGATLPLTPEAKMVLAEYEKADVVQFLMEYWVLPPAERQQRWNALDKRCHDADNRDTLFRLKDGLKVDVKFHSNLTMQTMAEFIREIYLLPTRSRAIRRMEWCIDQPRETISNAKADPFQQVDPDTNVASVITVSQPSIANQFQRVDPEMASLEPTLIKYLQNPKTAPTEVESLSPKSLELLIAKQESVMQMEQPRPVAKRPWYRRDLSLSFKPWLILLGLSILGRAIIGIGSIDKPNAVPSYPSNPDFVRQKVNRDMDGYRRDLERLTPQQFNDLLRHVPNSGKPPPLYYFSWTLLGKPLVQPKPSAMRP